MISAQDKQLILSTTKGVSMKVSYSVALQALKDGKRVAREGWNGKGMFVLLIRGEAVAQAIQERYGDEHPVRVNDFTMLCGADGKLSTWVPSSTDQLAEDWIVL